MSGLGQLRESWRRDERGGVAIIFALSILVLMLLIGLAVDTARYQNIAGRMQQALDGASLAAAKLLSDPNITDSEIKDRAKAFYEAAAASYGVEGVPSSALDIAIDRVASSVEVSGKINMPLLFGGVAGLPPLQVVNQKSKVVYDMTSVELAMVLDITGSMNANGKLADLKSAAKDVVDTLFDGALNDTNVRIALAPYSASVNAGELAAAVSAAAIPASCPVKPKKGAPCVDLGGVAIDTCVIERTGGRAATDAAPTGADAIPTMSSPPFGNYSCPLSSVIPLSDRTERDTLKSNIDGYVAGGATAGHIGTAWGWYLLSPNWSAVLPADSVPKAYGDGHVQKAMIVMTDGEFNTSYTGAADKTAESYAYFDSLCAGAKASGITVYTVGFDLNLPNALAHLEACASSPAQFYDAKTGAQLKDAFKDIANKLGNLRVAG